MKKIAIVGKMHSGKTTLAEALIGLGYSRFAFADPVKEIAAKMLTTFSHEMGGEGPSYTYDDMNAMKGHPSIRALLQLVGTELGRNWYGPDDIWIKMFKQRVLHAQGMAGSDNPLYIVNDDCRFPNEAFALKDVGFTIVKLERDENERVESIRQALQQANPDLSPADIAARMHAMLTHPSETNVDLIVPDMEIPSMDVIQLQLAARILHEHDLKELAQQLRTLDAGVYV